MAKMNRTITILPILGILSLLACEIEAGKEAIPLPSVPATAADSLSALTSNSSGITSTNAKIPIVTVAKGSKEALGARTLGRSKRLSDPTIEVVALCMTQGLRIPDLLRVKNTARRIRRSVTGRRRRSPDGSLHPEKAKKVCAQAQRTAPRLRRQIFGAHHQSYEYHESRVSSSSTRIRVTIPVTEMQKFYNVINYDFPVASAFREEYLSQSDVDLSSELEYIDRKRVSAIDRLIIVDPNGISCRRVCAAALSNGGGYGTIGICTAKFCECSARQTIFHQCRGNAVFDPITRSCDDPRNVILCDDVTFESRPQGGPIFNGGYSFSRSHSYSSTIISH